MTVDWTANNGRLIAAAQGIVAQNESASWDRIAAIFSETHRVALGGASISGEQMRSALRRAAARQPMELPNPRPYWTKYAAAIQRPVYDKQPGTAYLNADILVLPDIHFSLHDAGAIETALTLGADCNIAVVSGDLLDCYALSRFEKYHSGSIEDEMEMALWFLEYLSTRFERVYVLSGNHEDRAKKAFAKDVPPELSFMVSQGGDIIEHLCRPFGNVYAVQNSWYVQLNDAIICHAPTAKSQSVASAQSILDFFLHWRYRLDISDFRVIVQSHIHRASEAYVGDIKLIEAGCLCRPSEYRERAMVKIPETQGCVILRQRDGMSLQNQCRFYRY